VHAQLSPSADGTRVACAHRVCVCVYVGVCVHIWECVCVLVCESVCVHRARNMQITVEHPTRGTIWLDVSPNRMCTLSALWLLEDVCACVESVLALMCMIHTEGGMPCSQQRLEYNGALLRDRGLHATLAECGITADATLSLDTQH